MLHCVSLGDVSGRPAVAGGAWLSAAEARRARAFVVEKRRRDWLCGRRAAKEACARVAREQWGSAPRLADLQVDGDPSGAPYVRLAAEAGAQLGFAPGQRLPIALSISHSAGVAFCAAAAAGEVRHMLGVDLERIERRAPEFAADFLAAEEIEACAAGDVDLRVTAVWSAKEAVLKAFGLGLTVDTRTVVCIPDDAPVPAAAACARGWRSFRILRVPGGRDPSPLVGLWRTSQGFVQAVVHGAAAGRERGGP